MSKSVKIIIALVVLAVVVGGIWMFKSSSNVAAPASSTNSQTSANTVSNTSVDADVQSIDAEMSNINSDSANIDAGLNDKSVPQAQ